MAIRVEEIIALNNNENPDELLTPRQAAEYLAQLWGRPFTAKDFINLRTNAQKRAEALGVPLSTLFPIEPIYSDTRITMWRKKDLRQLAETTDPPKLRQQIRKPRRRRCEDA